MVGGVSANVGVSGVDGAPPQEGTVTISNGDSTLLPEPSTQATLGGGDAGAQLALLVLESAREDKKLGRSMREMQERAQEAAEETQLRAMKEKADDTYCAGLFSGFGMVASGAVTAVGAGATGKATAANSAKLTAYDASAKLADAGGKIGSTCYTASADDANQEVERQSQLAGRHKRAADDARDDVKEAKELVDRAVSFYKEYMTAKADATRAALVKA